ncbi:MAG: hypothetical protein WCK75_07890 [Elusimicrobiota bacterium]
MIDEYFADIISDIIVGISSKSVSSDGKTSLHVWDIFGGNHLSSIKTYLSEGCTEIPNYVAEYKANKISYETMWEKAMSSIFHLFTQYIHARAFADCMPTEILIFDSPEVKSLPFVQKYIPKSLSDFLQQLRNYPAKMTLIEWRDMETKLFPLGEKCFSEIWDRLEAPKTPKPPEAPLFLRLLSYLLKQEGGHA